MPKINRARIINFSYNNNNRHIIDETFDFYGGENALLNLKNGGGKSVLVQAVFQPIIPKTRLMGRPLEDFFKAKRTPSYIMLEWALEDKGGYLLTGIALARRESRTVEEAESGVSLKYFTFIVKYREANDFDIRNIGLTKRNKKGIEIADFKEARTLLDTKKASDKFEISVYGEDDRTDYRDELMSYGISQEEWRSVILNINQTEGGVIEIFDKSKTSQQLLNEWILKSIEKVMNGEEDKDNRKLGQMLENVVKEIIDNEKFIRDKEILEGFMKRSEELVEGLNRVEECLGRLKDKKQVVAELFFFASNKKSSCEEEKAKNENSIEEQRAEINKIELEQLSKDYYEAKEALDRLQVELEAADKAIAELQSEFEKLDYEERLERASFEYQGITGLQGQLAAVRLDIQRLTGECDEKKRIEALEYSLKIKYEELIKSLNKGVDTIKAGIEEGNKKLSSFEGDKKELDENLQQKRKEQTNVKRDIEDFQRYEKEVKEKLILTYERNILKEVEKGYFHKEVKDFDRRIQEIGKEINSIAAIIEDKIEEKNLLKEELAGLTDKDKQYAIENSQIAEKLDTYYKAEEVMRPVFQRHNINWNSRFNLEDNKRFLEYKINEKEDELKKIIKQLNTVQESLECIKAGSFNLPRRLIDYLKKEGIEYITGENYLRKLDKSHREKLLQSNPLLPYSFVMTTEQIETLREVYFDFPVNQMVPLIDYKDLEAVKAARGPIVSLNDGISFLCIYDKKIVDFESLSDYEDTLKKDEASLKENMAHLEAVLKEYRKDLNMVEGFGYTEDYSIELEKTAVEIEKAIEKVAKAIQSNKESYNKVEAAINNYNNSRNSLIEKEKKAEADLVILKDFINRDSGFMEDLGKELLLSREINKLEKDMGDIESQVKALHEALSALAKQEGEIGTDLKNARLEYEPYKDSEVSEFIDEDINILEKELLTIRSQLSSNLDRLKDDLERYSEECDTKEKLISSYNIPLEVYKTHRYDDENLKLAVSKKDSVSNKIDNTKSKKIKIETKIEGENGNLNRCIQNLQDKNAEPLPKREILLNFKQRKADAAIKISNLSEKNKRLSDDIYDLRGLLDKIRDRIDVTAYISKSSYKPVKGPFEDFEEFKKELDSIRKEGNQYKNAVKRMLTNIFAEYKDKLEVINNIQDGISSLIEKLDISEDNYYFLGERMLQNIDGLRSLIRACEMKLETVEKSKRDLIQHCYYHGKRVYDEIEKVAENSSIKLEGHNRPIPMLKIDMEPLSEEKESKEKMRLYIEDCIAQISKDIKAEVKYEEAQKKMFKFMSTRELLNELSELSKARVFAYKIDINVHNRGYKTWEQVMKENSGGERFVAFFTVLVALMSYTRMNGKSPDDYRRNKDTKVLIMDNPFGPISSEHLLRPLFQIAEKYHTQLICLTDLKQNSILNCFDLIYMIKIRTNTLGTNEYIELEKQLQPDRELKQDESLEKAVFRAEDVEQISLI